MTTAGPAFTEDEYKTRTYEDLSSEFQKLYPQAVRAYQLIPQMYNRLTLVNRLSHKEAMLKMANDHKHLPGFSDRNVRRYLPSHNPNVPHRVGTSRPKNSVIKAADGTILSINEHKHNGIENDSTSTHISTSPFIDMDYDVTKVSRLQSEKHEEFAPSSSPLPPSMTLKSTIERPSSLPDNDNQEQNNNLLPFEFSLTVVQVLGHFVPIVSKKGHEEDRVWFSGILNKTNGQVISATIGRISTEKSTHTEKEP